MFGSDFCRSEARDSLRNNNYWGAFGTSILLSIIVSGANIVLELIVYFLGGFGTTVSDKGTILERLIEAYLRPEQIIAFFVSVIFTVVVINPLIVGQSQYYISLVRAGYGNTGDIFSGFFAGYKKIVVVSLVAAVKRALWTMLLIVPGIIKTYEYMYIPYLLAANPDLETKRYFEIAGKAMKGFKLKFFKLQLSFIALYIAIVGVSLFTAGIGMIGFAFVTPYAQTAYAVFFDTISKYAVNNGIATPEEVGLDKFPPKESEKKKSGGKVFSWQ